jgi:hypothetical protein
MSLVNVFTNVKRISGRKAVLPKVVGGTVVAEALLKQLAGNKLFAE